LNWLRATLRRLAGTTERRLALVILLTTMVPLAAAIYLATSLFRQASALWFNPEIGEQLDRGVDIYKDYVKAVKDDLKHQAIAIAADPVLREAAKHRNLEILESELDEFFPNFPELVSLTIYDAKDQILARRDRGRPVNDASERSLEVRRDLSDQPEAPILVASFAVSRKRLDELERAGFLVSRYHQLEASRTSLYQGYLRAFALLLCITALVTIILGAALARGLTKRITRLGAAINVVAQGDLSVRVPVTGSDELTDLARTFNRMINEMADSRARIEFLQHVGAWQDMAQRLAHEIKNPLTPILLAVQECHTQYSGTDVRYRQLLDTTLEIVQEEVGTLRRLVGNFSEFARLPHAELAPASLSEFLVDCQNSLGHIEAPFGDEVIGPSRGENNVEVAWNIPNDALAVAIDRQMLKRVLVNLILNSVQAVRSAQTEGNAHGHVAVSAERAGDGARIIVEDDGPGIHENVRGRVFDPYFTTKSDGTGLGLAIAKKIVVEHGGSIEAGRSEHLGGARFVVRLPGLSILDVATAAMEARERAKIQGVETVGPG
jgi:nitrogen fixation/metabolism regulation signal transduction histidine kinase